MSSWVGYCDAISVIHRFIRDGGTAIVEQRSRSPSRRAEGPSAKSLQRATSTIHESSGSHKLEPVTELRIDVIRGVQCIHGSRRYSRKASTQTT